MAPVNATILVAPGTYYTEDTMWIKKSLKLVGEDPETTIIKGGIYVKGKGVKVLAKGLTIKTIQV